MSAAMLLKLLELGEKRCQQWQGKGFGGEKSLIAEVRAATSRLPERDAIVFDVGANRGDWTRELLSRAGSRIGKVYCFEPSAVHQQELRSIGDDRVVVVAQGIADSAGRRTLYAERTGSPMASLVQRDLAHAKLTFGPVETVDVTTIDRAIETFGIEVVHFAKLDIEGLEYMALRGAEQALEKGRVRALSFEFGGTDIDSRTYFRDFWQLLTRHGYRIARINPIGAPRLIKRYGERNEVFTTTNFFAWTEK